MLRSALFTKNLRELAKPIHASAFQSVLLQSRVAHTCSTVSFTGLPASATDSDKQLRDDVKTLGKMLGSSIRNYNPKVFESVEKLRGLGKKWRSPEGDHAAFDAMVEEVRSFDPQILFGTARSFSNFLALSNSAENHHRIRRLHQNLIESKSEFGLWNKEDSMEGSICKQLGNGKTPEELFHSLQKQKVEIVLTAHPTEVNRRTLLKKHQQIQEILKQLDHNDITQYHRKQSNAKLAAIISSIWESDDLRRIKPTPLDEAKSGFSMVEQVFWEAIPSYLRKLDDVVKGRLGKRLPPDYSPIKIASWMGGDRDGNPNVTPEITEEVCMSARWTAANLLRNDIKVLRGAFSMKKATKKVQELSGDASEPYREILKKLEKRLQATLDWSSFYILNKGNLPADWQTTSIQQYAPILHKAEILDPLLDMYHSLVENGMQLIAEDELLDLIRKVSTFGPELMPLDVRQESTRHSEALDAITRHLGVGSYLQWDETTRRNWLNTELASKRPLLPRHVNYTALGASSAVTDTLRTFETIARIPRESLGAYVISQCQQVSDILAVMLLQQEFGMTSYMRVVPLFETLDDLLRAKTVVNELFTMPCYVQRIHGHQEIMVGYSDSAKDAGRIAASWAQYNSQLDMVEAAKKHNIELTFFHGKGGTIGRGGNPALFQAILAHPPNTINGRFRITEQGEVITQHFGDIAIAEKTFDLFTAGVFTEQFITRPTLKPEWIAMMETLSNRSCDIYREVVRHNPHFVKYFRTATPELELANLNVGSRPSKRNPKGGIESLRAIPWNFAWTQTRLNLPTWLGVGQALQEQLLKNPILIREMFQEWPWFATFIDLLEMIFVKSDTIIAENYDQQLISSDLFADSFELLKLGKELRENLYLATKCVLEVSGHHTLQSNNELLLKSLLVRNPYIDPLNIIQVEVLKRLREHERLVDEKELLLQSTSSQEIVDKLMNDPKNQGKLLSSEDKKILQDTLLITINGIANGMRNSG